MKIITLVIFFILFINGCVVVKYDEQTYTPPQKITLADKPTIPMSETLVRSESGDMIGYLPLGWFFIDLGESAPSDIFACAVNEDYTLSAVFSKMRNIPEIEKAKTNNDLVSLARESIKLQKSKSPGRVELIGNINSVNVGDIKFSSYQVSTTAGALVSNVACYISSFGNVYRFSLIPMDIKGKPIPTQKEANVIFESMLATIKY